MSCLSVEQRLCWLCWLVGFIYFYARFQGIKEGLMSQLYQKLKNLLNPEMFKRFWPQYRCVIFGGFFIDKSSVSDLQ